MGFYYDYQCAEEDQRAFKKWLDGDEQKILLLILYSFDSNANEIIQTIYYVHKYM